MRFRLAAMVITACCALTAVIVMGCQSKPDDKPSPNPTPNPVPGETPNGSTGAAGGFSPYMPDDVHGGVVNAQQYDYDSLSWEQFIALNWPAMAGQRGVPDTTRSLGYGGPVVWETWKDVNEVFLPEGAKPDPWDSPIFRAVRLPSLTAAAEQPGLKLMVIPTKITVAMNQAGIFNGKFSYTGSLIDQNGLYTRYEVRMNKAEFDYIYNNNYYNGAMQSDSVKAGRFHFPPGIDPGSPTSTEVKAAWRVLVTANPAPGQQIDDTSRYYTRRALLVDPETGQTIGPVTVGLVGLHILRLTPHAHNWVWSTFEQVDNLSTKPGGPRPSYNPSDTMTRKGPNGFSNRGPVVSAPVTEPAIAKAVLVWRYYAIGDPRDSDRYVPSINAYFQAKLASVPGPWKYYELIGTQNPRPLSADPDTGRAAPAVTHLNNSTMETYVQATNNCYGCHLAALPLGTTDAKKFGTFTFVLQKAQFPAAAGTRPKGLTKGAAAHGSGY